jgi:hypothetical protein
MYKNRSTDYTFLFLQYFDLLIQKNVVTKQRENRSGISLVNDYPRSISYSEISPRV